MRLLPFLLVAALVLVGCRESLTDFDPGPDPVGDPNPAPNDLGPDVRSIYVKAPVVLGRGQTGGARAEPLREAARYRWTFSGAGEVNHTFSDPQGLDRLVTLEAVSAGDVFVTVRAYDAEGDELARGSATFPVLNY